MRKYILYIIITVLGIALLLTTRQCSNARSFAEANYVALTDTVQHFKNGLGTQTASIKTLQMENSQLQNIIIGKDKELSALSKEFSKIRSVVKFRTVTQFDTIQISYKDTVPCVFERIDAIADKWYSFGYRSDQKGLAIDNFKTWTSATMITGTKRKWFLGEEVVKTDITLSNPHMAITDITAAEVVLPSPWYRKWYVWLAVGAVGGFVMAR